MADDETPAETEPTEPTADEPTTDARPDVDDWTMGDIDDDHIDDDDQWTMGVMVEPEPTKRATFEWSTWGRLGYGVAVQPPALAARATTPLMPEASTLGEGALGVDASVGLAHRGAVRLGAWAEWRTVSEPVLGGELIVGGLRSPHGSGSLGIVLRAGGNARVTTGALGFGYAATDSWLGLGHATGVRFVTSMTRSRDDAQDWSVTVGVEFDPIGALGYLVSR